MRQGLWSVKLKGIRRQRRGDRVVRYHRATGIRLPDDIPETHPDFIDAWAKAEAQAADPAKVAEKRHPTAAGSITAGIRALRSSADYKGFSESYRHIIKRETDAIILSYGTLPLAGVRQRHIEADLDKLDPNPANARLKAWRLLFRIAKRLGLTPDDPTAGIKKRTAPTAGHATWSAEDIAIFRGRHEIGTVARACFELVLWTGARTCDAVRIGRANIDGDGVLSFRQVKTGGMAYVPWTSPLPPWASIWAQERDGVHLALECLSGGFTFLEAHGRVRSVKGLGNVINNAARDAGLKKRTAHGLRKARLTMIAEAGGTAHAIMAWGGHSSMTEVQRYTRAAERKRLILGNGTSTEQCISANFDTKRDAKPL